MEEYGLTREDWDSVMEIGDLKNRWKDEFAAVPAAVKAAFTRK